MEEHETFLSNEQENVLNNEYGKLFKANFFSINHF